MIEKTIYMECEFELTSNSRNKGICENNLNKAMNEIDGYINNKTEIKIFNLPVYWFLNRSEEYNLNNHSSIVINIDKINYESVLIDFNSDLANFLNENRSSIVMLLRQLNERIADKIVIRLESYSTNILLNGGGFSLKIFSFNETLEVKDNFEFNIPLKLNNYEHVVMATYLISHLIKITVNNEVVTK